MSVLSAAYYLLYMLTRAMLMPVLSQKAVWIYVAAQGSTIGNAAATADKRSYVTSNAGVGIAVDAPGVTVTNVAVGVGPSGENAGNSGTAGIYLFSTASDFRLVKRTRTHTETKRACHTKTNPTSCVVEDADRDSAPFYGLLGV